jgi:formiminotetrahydrofolate cyclodeaminase
MNVRINVANLKDEKGKTSLSNKVQVFTEESEARFKEISKLVEKKLKG